MRTTIVTTLCCVVSSLAVAPDLRAQGTISEVTVLEDRARVTRRVTTSLIAGINQVEVPELPISLATSSILAEVDGVPARVLGVRLDPIVHEADIRADVLHLEDDVRSLTVAERAAVSAAEVERKKRVLTDRFGDFLRQALLERSTRAAADETERLLAAEEWVSARSLAADDRAASLSKEIEELRRRRSEVEENLTRLRSGSRRLTHTAVVQVEAAANGEGTLRIGYDVPDAWWLPVYEARLDESSGEVAFSYGAEIVQGSGEDWIGVDLTLSTQRSSLGLTPPSLVPLRVSGHTSDGRNAMVAGRAAGSASTDFADSLAEDSSASGDDDLARARIEGGGAVARFRIPFPATIPADRRRHRVPILEEKLSAELAFECVPRLRPHTFRRGRLVNRTEAPFLPGSVRIFREGAYVGETAISSVPPGGSFRLSFGVEGRIVVHRTEITDRERETGSFRKGDRRTLGWIYSIRSALPERATLVLVDRMPVSEIEGVIVEATKRCAPRPETDPDGICRWQVPLVSGESSEVTFEYQVTAPQGMEIPLGLVD